MKHYSWRKIHSIVEILCQSGDKKALLEKAMLKINKIDEMDIPPTFRKQINAIKKDLLLPENVQMISRVSSVSCRIHNLSEDEVDDIIHVICELESFLNPN